MKTFITLTFLLLLPISQVLAHEGESEVTDVAASDWVGPVVAAVIIVVALVIARIIRTSRNKTSL